MPRSIKSKRRKPIESSKLPSFDKSNGTTIIIREKPYSVDLDELDNEISVLEKLAKKGYDGLTLDNVIIRLKAVKKHYE